MSKRWTTKDLPSQHGRTFVVTGTGGLGYLLAAQATLLWGTRKMRVRSHPEGAQR